MMGMGFTGVHLKVFARVTAQLPNHSVQTFGSDVSSQGK